VRISSEHFLTVGNREGYLNTFLTGFAETSRVNNGKGYRRCRIIKQLSDDRPFLQRCAEFWPILTSVVNLSRLANESGAEFGVPKWLDRRSQLAPDAGLSPKFEKTDLLAGRTLNP
jgi:hypothetical protein